MRVRVVCRPDREVFRKNMRRGEAVEIIYYYERFPPAGVAAAPRELSLRSFPPSGPVAWRELLQTLFYRICPSPDVPAASSSFRLLLPRNWCRHFAK